MVDQTFVKIETGKDRDFGELPLLVEVGRMIRDEASGSVESWGKTNGIVPLNDGLNRLQCRS